MEKEYIERAECRQIQIGLLEKVAEICDKNHLTYYLAYGTLLGAVRHKGFIPWDDDIDIFLARDEYERLLELLRTENIGCDWLEVLNSEKEGYFYPFTKIIDNRTCAKMEDNLTEHGIWIDVFPVDGLPESECGGRFFLLLCTLLRAVMIAMTTDFTTQKNVKKTGIKKFLNAMARLAGRERAARLYEWIVRRYDVRKSKYVSNLFSMYIKREKMEGRRLFQTTVLEFEGKQFTAPAEWDVYLTQIYGDYMQLPPEDKRRTHCITAYRKRKEE